MGKGTPHRLALTLKGHIALAVAELNDGFVQPEPHPAPPETATKEELYALRGAKGHMFRNAKGVVQINPAPNARGPHLSIRRNARKAVIEGLKRKGWLVEGEHRFDVTAAGDAALALAGSIYPRLKEDS